jgi:hypothetical protein
MTASILNKLEYNRRYPYSVASAPQKVFGCGLLDDLRIEQGLTHIQSFLDYVGTNHKIGRVMLILLRHLQVEAGVSFDLQRFPSTEIPYLTNCWMVTLCRFCAEFDISIKSRSNRIPVLACYNDSCLMDSALRLGFTRQELIDVNLVRIFHQVTTMSDIASADRQSILLAIWQGQHTSDRHSSMSFARQLQPTTYQRGLWRRLLRSHLVPSSKASHLRFITPLGSWLRSSNMI